eukprot:3590296-Pyramimonas_sp.AAC.1
MSGHAEPPLADRRKRRASESSAAQCDATKGEIATQLGELRAKGNPPAQNLEEPAIAEPSVPASALRTSPKALRTDDCQRPRGTPPRG